MKKSLFLFCAAILAALAISAQEPAPPSGSAPNPCDIVVTGDFDSECFYSLKDEYFDEYPDLMIACKHSTVTYTAYTYTGTATVSEYIWEISGAVSHTATGDHCTVAWNDVEWGLVVVTIVTSDGDTCWDEHHVKLIDNPTASCVTIPAYTVLSDGSKVVRVCKGMSVTFIDQSDPGNSDIAGIHWECSNNLAQPSSTPTYTIENVYMATTVTHRVYNNCGCYDEEEIQVETLVGEALELDCYGTVCEGAVVEYHATSPSCQNFQWYVDGGTLIGGQGTDYPIVQWDHPVNGYGVIGLDGHLCGNGACPSLMSKMVPVIQNHLAIEGKSDVCVGESVVFSLPLFGSTEYRWSITPASGIDNSMINNTNEIRILFLQPGDYRLSCTYECGFLGCGQYETEELAITVKPQFSITGNNRICIANACDLQTAPAVAATWTAYDLGNSNAAVGSPTTGTTFSRTFSHAGRYLVTAENSAWCGPATFVLEVRDVPPAPTAGDLDPANRHTACPNEGIALNGTPSELNYNLVWEPVCSTASPQQYSGDSVTISYQSEVCDVRVYNYDVVLQCQSTDYYVHQVTELTPAPLNIPAPITVCPGTEIDWTSGQIPDQRDECILYEWTIFGNKQYCATVQGSHFVPGIILQVNEIQPTSFQLVLNRRYCNILRNDTIDISVLTENPATLAIAGADQVCVGSSATYTGSGGNPGTYQWTIDGVSRTGNPVSQAFSGEGQSTVTLCGSSMTYCTNVNYHNCTTKTVTVNPLPEVYDIVLNGTTVSLLPAGMTSPSYSFYWTYRSTEQSPEIYLGNTPSVTALSAGSYSCTVTDNSTGCSRTISKVLPDDMGCDTMALSASYDVCTQTLTLVAPQHQHNVIWKVTGGSYSIVTSGTNNCQADITFEGIGTYSITAQAGMIPCYKGRHVKTVDFIPYFEFEQACGSINIINHSRYASPGGTVYITVTDSYNNTDAVSFPMSQSVYTYTPTVTMPNGTCTYSFKLSGYGAATITPPCNLGDITTTMVATPSNPITITTANSPSNHTCDNTPIELTATLNIPGLTVVSSTWDFDDNSGYTIAGNKVFHTFAAVGLYYVTVTVTDNLGCQRTASYSLAINSHSNSIHGGIIRTDDPIACPFFGTINLEFDRDYTGNRYQWWRHKAPTHVPNIYPYPSHQSDDYFTYVINNNYCQAEATTFVKFKNAPTARIYSENFNCCVGNEVMLYGETGPSDDQMSYSWSVTGPSPTNLTNTTADNFSFTPAAAGAYTVTLTVTNSQGCSSTASETVTANPKPSAPTIVFAGSACISDAPVELTATGCTGEVHWSNGTTGSTAYYFTPGVVNAYCFDPAVGCNSDTANRTIIRQPDLDALLTGCYEKCKAQSSGYLPLYGIAAYWQTIWYSWNHPAGLLSGYYTNNGTPLLLPYSYGSHYLTVSAPDPSCPRTSSVLRITEKEVCDCDSVEVTYTVVPRISECVLSYIVNVTICNHSTTNKFCIGDIEIMYPQGNATINTEDLTGSVVSSNDCGFFTIGLDVFSLIPSELLIRLTDSECSACTKDFAIDLKTAVIECPDNLTVRIDEINTALSSDVAAYFDFSASVSASEVLAFWSEPPMVVNYSGYPGALHGLGMIDMATLVRLVAQDSVVCFYAIICENDQLCLTKYCIDAFDLYQMVLDAGVLSWRSKGSAGAVEDGLQLKPNPTTGDVRVVGTMDEVTEVLVMDMHGKAIASHNNTASFNIESLSSGMYIVRVKTKSNRGSAEKVTYLKLVKK